MFNKQKSQKVKIFFVVNFYTGNESEVQGHINALCADHIKKSVNDKVERTIFNSISNIIVKRSIKFNELYLYPNNCSPVGLY
jgi:hypothetical protein